MAAADNFPLFNQAVTELTLKVQTLISDVGNAQASLGPEVAAALLKLEEAKTASLAAIAAAETATDAAEAVAALETAFNAAMVTVGELTTDVATLNTQVGNAMTQLTTTQAALEDALEAIDGISGNMATVKRLTPAGISVAGHASGVINPAYTAGTGGLMLLGVYCTTSTPLQMYDVLIKIGSVTLYEARGVLGPLNDTFSHFQVAAGAMEITLTNNGNTAALLTPTVIFTELAIV